MSVEEPRPKFLHGYVVGHYPSSLVPFNNPSPHLKITINNGVNLDSFNMKKAVSFFPKLHVRDVDTKMIVCPPMIPDQRHPYNHIAGVMHRFGRDMPPLNDPEVGLFTRYARMVIRKHFDPIDPQSVKNMDEWFRGTPYGASRVAHLSQTRLDWQKEFQKMARSQGFIKWESYADPKNPRFICSPSDLSKMIIASIQAAVDKKTFEKEWFVKGSQPKEWPRRLEELFGNVPVMGTDFSSFEAHHRDQYSDIIHYWIMHMIRGAGFTSQFRRIVSRLLKGRNIVGTSVLVAMIVQRLMSGAQWTSSANGMLNFLLLSYMTGRTLFPLAPPEWLAENLRTFFKGLFEGDDGMTEDVGIPRALIARLGLDLKFDRFTHYSKASFCGIVCDPRTMKVVANPQKVLRNFSALPLNFADMKEAKSMAMLRAKALSYKYNFNDCPVIGPLCHKVCDLTRSCDPRSVMSETDSWKRDALNHAIKDKLWKNPPCIEDSTRKVVEEAFGITVRQQLMWEEEIEKSTTSIDITWLPFARRVDLEHMQAFVSDYRTGGNHNYQHVPKLVREAMAKRVHRSTLRPPRSVVRAEQEFERVAPGLPYDQDVAQIVLF